MASYLNLIELATGRELRLAQFGFHAERPSFVESGICFLTDGKWKHFSLETGGVSDYSGALPAKSGGARIEFTFPPESGIGYCQLIVAGAVVNNFMGSAASIGDAPISPDGRMVVFVGYPSREGFSA